MFMTSKQDTASRDRLIHSPAIRQAGAELLSMALMDARNHSLQLYSQVEGQLDARAMERAMQIDVSPPLWELGRLAWYQEYWIARNLQRGKGAACDPTPVRLASQQASADLCWNPALSSVEQRWRMDLPDAAATRGFLLQTLETSLELLEKTDGQDRSLYFFRLALMHEDQWFESLCRSAQAMGWAIDLPAPAALAQREPLLLPSTRWNMGWTEAGFALDNELPAHEIQLPEYEIDAQPVTWAQYVEFVDDGGYDRAELWQPEGWAWLEDRIRAEGRRGPRHVEQIGVASGAVMLTRFGRATRMSGSQPVQHVSWWEADAWCRWAGRRLPAEVEWEAASGLAARRGFVWGGVWEWTASTFRGYPGFAPGSDRDWTVPWLGRCKSVRGASFATRPRLRHEKFRGFLEPHCDDAFVGFRSCAA